VARTRCGGCGTAPSAGLATAPPSAPATWRREPRSREVLLQRVRSATGGTRMNLVQECSFKAMLKPPVPIGAGPVGTRMYYEVDGGEVTGERLRGQVLGGGEWALIGPDGFLRIDVRLQVETHDAAFIYVQYVGLLELNEAVQRAIAT